MNKISVILITVALTQGAKLPNYITKCAEKDPELSTCIVNSANSAWPTIIKGDPVYHLPPMDPLKIPFLHADVDGNLFANLTNVDLTGMADCKFEEFKIDFEKKHVDILFFVPRMNFVGEYEVSGKLLFLPLEGKGPSNVTYVNMKNNMWFEYELKNKNGKKYIEITKRKLIYEVTRAHFRLENLFNGDERLGGEMNKIFDESWEAVNEEVGASFGNVIGEVFIQIIQEFLRKLPYNELFS